jgi:hypothetical protein
MANLKQNTGTSEALESGPAEAAAYVGELAGDLALIARKHGLDTLGYILDMAKLEADNVARLANGRQ